MRYPRSIRNSMIQACLPHESPSSLAIVTSERFCRLSPWIHPGDSARPLATSPAAAPPAPGESRRSHSPSPVSLPLQRPRRQPRLQPALEEDVDDERGYHRDHHGGEEGGVVVGVALLDGEEGEPFGE